MHRDTNPELADVERAFAERIRQALQKQYHAVQLTAAGPTIDATVHNVRVVLNQSSSELLLAAGGLLSEAAALGIETAAGHIISAGMSVGFSWELANQRAVDFVTGYNFDLVTGINQTTENRLRRAMQNWIANGGTLDDLATSIQPIFEGEEATAWIESLFGIDRGWIIAETEATRAFVNGKIGAYTSSGIANTEPPIRPPDDSHVRCRCDVVLEERDGQWVWVWLTARDEAVCQICGPRHDTAVGPAWVNESEDEAN